MADKKNKIPKGSAKTLPVRAVDRKTGKTNTDATNRIKWHNKDVASRMQTAEELGGTNREKRASSRNANAMAKLHDQDGSKNSKNLAVGHRHTAKIIDKTLQPKDGSTRGKSKKK
jgi:hypothetical protein